MLGMKFGSVGRLPVLLKYRTKQRAKVALLSARPAESGLKVEGGSDAASIEMLTRE